MLVVFCLCFILRHIFQRYKPVNYANNKHSYPTDGVVSHKRTIFYTVTHFVEDLWVHNLQKFRKNCYFARTNNCVIHYLFAYRVQSNKGCIQKISAEKSAKTLWSKSRINLIIWSQRIFTLAPGAIDHIIHCTYIIHCWPNCCPWPLMPCSYILHSYLRDIHAWPSTLNWFTCTNW